MNLMNIFGGDWNAGMMQGFQMAALMDQRQLQQQQFQRQMANDAMLNEERRLKIEEHRRQLENRNKLIDQFRPQISKKTWEQPDIETGQSSTMTNTSVSTSPLFQAIANMYGPDKASLIGSLMEVDPEAGMKMLGSIAPKELTETGMLSLPSSDPRVQNYIRNKQAVAGTKSGSLYSDFASGYKAKLQAEHPEWTPEQINLATAQEAQRQKLEDQRAIIDIRYPPFQQATNLPAGYTFNRKTGKFQAPDGTEVSPMDFAGLFGEGAGQKADMSALRDLTKRRELIGSFTNRIDANTKVVEQLAKKYGNTDARLLNIPINKLKQYMGSGEFASLQLALRSLSNEIAKVESGSLGIAEVSVQQAEAMNKIHDPNLSVADMMKVLETGKLLGRTSMGAIDEQVTGLKNRIKVNVGAYNGNNPLNVKQGGATQKWVDNGTAVIGRRATDGGNFLKFNSPQEGIQAAKDLLFNSGIYSNLTVNEAMKKWSNGGYDGKIILGLGPKKISSLNDSEKDALVNAMLKAEGNGSMVGISQQPASQTGGARRQITLKSGKKIWVE